MAVFQEESVSSAVATTKMFEIYIRASAEQIWEALTSPEWSQKYGYRAIYEYELRPGGRFAAHPNEGMRRMGLPDPIIDGEVIEAKKPNRLVQTYRFLFTPEDEAEGFTRITHDIVPTEAGFCRVTITHEVANAPRIARAITSRFDTRGGGGWGWVLSDLKTLLETGKSMAG
jgi:uncharacterized protein YndB with AHSA1/START domain